MSQTLSQCKLSKLQFIDTNKYYAPYIIKKSSYNSVTYNESFLHIILGNKILTHSICNYYGTEIHIYINDLTSDIDIEKLEYGNSLLLCVTGKEIKAADHDQLVVGDVLYVSIKSAT